MSLINDALKQASRSQREQGSGSQDEISALKPVDYHPARSGVPLWVLVAVLVVGLGAAGGFYLKWRQATAPQESQGRMSGTSVADPRVSSPAVPEAGSLIDASPVLPDPKAVAEKASPVVVKTDIAAPAVTLAPESVSVMASNDKPDSTRVDSRLGRAVGGSKPKEVASQRSTPVSPAVRKPPSFPSISIQGIFVRSQLVMIDGERYRLGNEYQGAKIVEIHPQTVVFEIDGFKKEVAAF